MPRKITFYVEICSFNHQFRGGGACSKLGAQISYESLKVGAQILQFI